MKKKNLLFLSLAFMLQLFTACNKCDCPCDCVDDPLVSDAHYWIKVQSPVTDELTGVFFINENVGWAVGNNSAIIKTINGGKSWSKQTYSNFANFNAVFFINENEGWIIGTYGTVVHTINGGTSWTLLTKGDQANGYTESFNELYFLNSKIGWIIGDNQSGGGGIILQTPDGGITWNKIVKDLPTHLFSLNVASSNRILVGGGFSGPGLLYDTYDGGENWYVTTMGADDFTIQGIGVYGSNIYLVCPWQNFSYVSTDDGSTWSKSTNFGNAGQIFVDNKAIWLIGGTIRLSTDNGETWTITTEANSEYVNDGNGIYGAFAIGKKAWGVADKGKTFYYE